MGRNAKPNAEGELVFINKTQSSELLSRSKPQETSRILSHVQSNRRKTETARGGGDNHSKNSKSGLGSTSSGSPARLPPGPPTPMATCRQLDRQDTASHQTPRTQHIRQTPSTAPMTGSESGAHVQLHCALHSAARSSFLAEAFAPGLVCLAIHPHTPQLHFQQAPQRVRYRPGPDVCDTGLRLGLSGVDGVGGAPPHWGGCPSTSAHGKRGH
ncbi:hypothetical protein B0H67DRAFT_676355 [Lasiosphaeris hirsuta]|uniref:Uncharacterized protein n=1 Tax=Lasiosphaeris hirsuta TaxID=260670 RepID=A0AA40DJI4_9PEZI|nr:hypothetical protein B0H67DRAFT_676355 [Lasiosphaeris hirsuta]